jgi:glycosyltransferase involved in cell wall biosynthesis
VNVRLYEWGVRRAAQVVVQNDEQARLCRSKFGRDPSIIPSIGDRPRRRARPPEAFLWVGRLQPLKRPDAYIELARAVPEARFWMIALPPVGGSADLRPHIYDAAAELPNLELLEPRSRAGIGQLLERSVAVVNTSEREGLPNLFLEGWARGVPALALSFDPDGLIARYAIGLFASGDQARFEKQARRLWRERDDQSELADRCIAYVRAEHDMDAVIERWLGTVVGDHLEQHP